MFTFHLSSHLSSPVRGGLALCWILLAMALAAQAQTKASCTFNFFSPTTPFKLPDGTPVFIDPVGINDFGTIVGHTSPPTAHRGLIRFANGTVTAVKGTKFLMARNDRGTSVGLDWKFRGVLVHGTTVTPIILDVNNAGVDPFGINKWSTVVGFYVNPDLHGIHGFKRQNNGTTHTLDFPGALGTQPNSINDNGAVVGYYNAPDGSLHGFIFHNGHWATLDYPHASDTFLVGITNTGKIIGNAFLPGPPFRIQPFLYENGTFKVISVPNSGSTSSLMSVSPKQGLILGVKDNIPGDPAFIAQCQ